MIGRKTKTNKERHEAIEVAREIEIERTPERDRHARNRMKTKSMEKERECENWGKKKERDSRVEGG